MRLIDADKLDFSIIKYMGEFCHVPLDDIISGWKKIVDVQPTAYDVDKVVEQLEKLSNDVISNIFAHEEDDHKGIYNDGLSTGYEKSIEIVKSGGIR